MAYKSVFFNDDDMCDDNSFEQGEAYYVTGADGRIQLRQSVQRMYLPVGGPKVDGVAGDHKPLRRNDVPRFRTVCD